ncbi:hypothetical protein [Paraburkholderia sp. GAS42]|uniref:hypothetical protein n=1 Tax=Paraburkholderia sp. GAS42 TaxID=3035135 RepID=UPI003D231C5E
MTIRARKHSVAWPGIFATWLMAFALFASQLLKLAETSDLVAANCSDVKSENAGQYTLPDSFSACDYCDIVAQQASAVLTVPAMEIAAILLATALTLALASLARIDDSSGRTSRCTEGEAASRKCSTPLQNQC